MKADIQAGSCAASCAKIKIRKIATFLEETTMEMGRKVDPPTRRAAAVAVIENPYAGRYVEDLSELMTIGEELGELLTERAVAALGIDGPSAQSYGKAAAVTRAEPITLVSKVRRQVAASTSAMAPSRSCCISRAPPRSAKARGRR